MRTGGVFVVVFVLVLVMPFASAQKNCLGHSLNVDSLSIDKGKQGVYSVSFFNLCEDPLHLDLRTENSPDLRIEIHPGDLLLTSEITNTPHSCEDCSWFVLSRGGYSGRYAKMYNVKVYVKIPSQITQNLYGIKLIATATPTSDTPEGQIRQTLAQIREINLRAYVSGSLSPGALRPGTPINYTRIDPSDLIGSEQEDSELQSGTSDFEVEKPKASQQPGSTGVGDTPSGYLTLSEDGGDGKQDLPIFEIIIIFLIVIIIFLFTRRE